MDIKTEKDAQKIQNDCKDADFIKTEIIRKQARKKQKAPFTTSTLQQTAAHRLGYSPKPTIMLAQQPYEGIDLKNHGHVGLITYMRTDSTTIAKEAITQCRDFIKTEFGKN